MIKTCIICEIQFKCSPCEVNRKYCSFKCRDIDYKKRFTGKNSSFYKGGKTTTYKCKFCDKEFIDFVSHPRIYCSTSCASSNKIYTEGKNWRGGVSSEYRKYGNNFTKKLKEIIVNRDKVCVDCGTNKGPFNVHHIDFNGMNCSVENLILLCKVCHGKRHYITLKNYYDLKTSSNF